jgi:hypothetical protein
MNEIHPLAPHHLPGFLPGPDGSDPLFTAVVIILLILLLVAGTLYFKLHSLPEQYGHKKNSTQLQLISILAVLALFTHNNAFWILALLIAAINIPDFLTPLKTIASSLAKLTEDTKATEPVEPLPEPDSDLDEATPPAPSVVEAATQPGKIEKRSK